MNFIRSLIFILLIVILVTPAAVFSKPRVIVSIPPQKAFVEAVAGEEVEIQVLLKPGQNPANFTLSPSQLGQLAKAEVYFSIGAPLEAFILPRIEANYPDLQIVDTSAGIRKRTLDDHSHTIESSNHGHEHVDDPHIWLSPGLVKIQMRHYSRTLKELLPQSTKVIGGRSATFIEALEEVDKEVADKLGQLKGTTIFVYHPAFGYFLDRYGLRQETVELKGKQPSPKQLRSLIAEAKAHKARVIFVQPQFSRNSAQTLAKAIEGTVKIMDPLAENYLDNLRYMGETIAKSYR